MEIVALVLLAFLALGVAGLVIKLFSRKKPDTQSTYSSNAPTASGELSSPPPSTQPRMMTEHERRHAKIKDMLRALPNESSARIEGLLERLKADEPLLSKEEILEAAMEVDFEMSTIVKAMAQFGFSPSETISFIEDNFDFDLVDLLKSLFENPQGVQSEWAISVINGIYQNYEVDDLDEEDLKMLADGSLALGVPKIEVARTLYDNDENLVRVVEALNPSNDVSAEAIAEVAQAASIDITEEDEYDTLRNTYPLNVVSGAMRIAGFDATTILDNEASYLNRQYENVSDAIDDLQESGVSISEILLWLIESSHHSAMYAEHIIADAFENLERDVVSEDELVRIATSLGEDTLAAEIEDVLIENNVSFEGRIEFLYKLYIAERDREPSPEEPTAIEEVSV